MTGDQWILDNDRMRSFIGTVKAIRTTAQSPEEAIARIRPHFADLLGDAAWLPARYQEPPAEGDSGGMGKRIGMWLLYRSGDGSMAFSALVLPPGMQTPVHDHLAWGLVGLYRGRQSEQVYARRDHHRHDEGFADVEVVQENVLSPGDFYDLLPGNDIHSVRTTSAETSVSLHLLSNDNGCIWRHRYKPQERRIEPFKSGWLNAECGHDHEHARA
ncbi:MAG: 3-mercaptopropionate dioxygenase [Phycisphaerae bacterium]|nr:3-mercaptopropionate dioxygenase [Phycisphaerae bacterium]